MQTLNFDWYYHVRVIGKTLTLPKHGGIILNSTSQTREKWNFLVFNRVDLFRVFTFTFCLEKTVRENNWMGTTSVDVMFSLLIFFENAIPNITRSQLCLQFFLKKHETPWQRHLKGTLQLKILRTWIKICVEPATRYLTYNFMLLFLSNKPSFKIYPSVD